MSMLPCSTHAIPDSTAFMLKCRRDWQRICHLEGGFLISATLG